MKRRKKISIISTELFSLSSLSMKESGRIATALLLILEKEGIVHNSDGDKNVHIKWETQYD